MKYKYTNNFNKKLALLKKCNAYISAVDVTLLIKNSFFWEADSSWGLFQIHTLEEVVGTERLAGSGCPEEEGAKDSGGISRFDDVRMTIWGCEDGEDGAEFNDTWNKGRTGEKILVLVWVLIVF